MTTSNETLGIIKNKTQIKSKSSNDRPITFLEPKLALVLYFYGLNELSFFIKQPDFYYSKKYKSPSKLARW